MADFLFNKPLEQDQQQTDKVKSITDYANEYTQKQNEHAANREKYGVEAPDEIYEVLNNFAQKSAGPEEDQEKNLARVAAAYAYSTNMNIPLEEAYVNLENYNAAIWGEDIFKNDRRSNGKAVMDQFKLGSNTVKQNKLGFKLMEAERDGDFELAEKINAEIAAIDEENALLQDYNPNNKLIKGLETIVQTVPFTLDVIAASAIGTISGTAVIPAFLESSRIQAGDVYKTLRDQGNSPEIARKVAIFTGSLQGLAESTIGEASNYFITKGMKGVGNGLSKAGADKLADYLTKKFALSNGFSKAVQIAGQYAISSVGEGAEELVQEVESILAENIAASLEDLTIPNTDAKDIAKRVTENFVGGIIGGLGLGVPGVMINTGLGIANVKRVEKAAKIIPSEEMYVNEMMKERTDEKGNTYRAADVIVHKDEEDLKNKLHDIWQSNAVTRNSEENVNAKGRARINPAAEGFEEYETDEESGEEIIPDAYRENGKLSVQDDRETYDDGTVHGEYRAGDRTKADKNLYGAINYTINEDNKTVTIDRFGMSSAREALRQEIYDSFAKKYTGYDIQWNAKGSQETAVRDAIIAANPMGKNAGLNYYTLDQVAAADAQTRNNVASQIQDAYKKVGIELNKEQIAADVAVMESLYNRIGRDIEGVNSFTDWYDFTFGENMFAEDASVAMKEGTEMGASQTRSLQQFREGMKALIYVTENGDFSTFSHEIAHIFRKQMQGDLLAQAEAAFGVQNGQWTRNQEERFAYGFEQFLRTGKAQNSALKELFTKIAQFLRDCFDALTKNGINITPEIEEVYNELLRGDESTLREAMRAAEESDKRYAAEREAAMKEQQQKEAEQKTAQEIDKESKGTTTFDEDTNEYYMVQVNGENNDPRYVYFDSLDAARDFTNELAEKTNRYVNISEVGKDLDKFVGDLLYDKAVYDFTDSDMKRLIDDTPFSDEVKQQIRDKIKQQEERELIEENAEDIIKGNTEEVAALLNMTPEEVENFFDTLMDESETLGVKDDAILDAAGNIFDDDLLSQSKKKKNLEEEDKTPRVDARRIQQAMDYLNSDAFDEKERNRIKNNLEKYEGSGWYKLVIQALTVRADMQKLFAGETLPDNSLFNSDKCDGYLEACQKGPDAIYEYFTRKSFIGEPEKPDYAVAGSFISCEPSADCVKYCYAVAGRSGMAMIIINRELINYCIEKDPIRAAQIVTSQWTHMDPYKYGKIPLRLLDTGDMSPSWIDFIKEMNSNEGYIPNVRSKKERQQKNKAVVCSIFSKRGELLSQVDPVANIIQLSVDKTNLDQAYKYPDLPLAIVFDGSDEMVNFITSQKNRFDMHKGVILPVTGKEATSKEDLKKLPRWALGYVCPINAGWQEIGEYHCGNCYLNGAGCNYGRSQKDRYNGYATYGEIPKGVRNDYGKEQRESLAEEFERITSQFGSEELRAIIGGKSGIERFIRFLDVQYGQNLGQFDNGRETRIGSTNSRTDGGYTSDEQGKKAVEGDTELLHQIIGELGATNLDRLEEVDTRIRNKQLAQWYETAGKDPLTIKRATGWEKGADGKWRYEIPDFKIKEHPTWTEMTSAGLVYHFGLLSELIDAPELFAAYPQLKTIAVDSDLISDSTEGSYNDLLNLISLNNHFEKRQNTEIYKEIVELEKTPEYQEWQARFDELEGETDPDLWEKKWDALDAEFKQTEIGKKYNELLNKPRYEKGLDPKLLSTLIHEVQHAIQSIEGFAAGGNPEMFPVINQYEVNDLIYKQREKVASLREKFESQINDEELLNHKIEYRQKLKAGASDEELEQFENQFYSQYKGYENLKTESEILDNYIHQFNKISTKGLTGKVDITDLLKMNPNNADVDVKETYVSPYEAYHRLAGEVESRNTQTRMDLSPEERLEKLLADTADVEPSQQIVMFNAMKEAMASEQESVRGDDELLYQQFSDPEEVFIFKYPEYSREDIVDAWHGKKVNGEDLLDKMDRERRQVEADYKKLIDNPAFVSLHTIEGDQERIIHKSPRNDGKGKWQMSLFDKYGPYSHVTFDELDEAYNRSYELPYRPDKVEVIWDDKIRYDEKYYDLINNNEMDAAQKLLEEYAAKKNYFGPLDTEVTDATDIAIPPTMRLKKKLYTQNDMDASGNEYGLLFQRKEINKATTKGIYLAANRARHEDYNMDYNDYDDRYGCNITGDMLQVDLSPYDYIIATPPCNFWSHARGKKENAKEYALATKHLLPETIKKLGSQKKPFIIENVRNVKWMEEEKKSIFELCKDLGVYVEFVGRHTYFTNVITDLNSVEQIQDFDADNNLINGDGYRQGGTNVHNVIEKWLDTVMTYRDPSNPEAPIIDPRAPQLLFQTQEEMLEEARQMESWQDWMQFYEVFGKPDVTPIPIDADAQWYKAVWEFANGVTTEDIGNRIVGDKGPAERASANDLDKMFIDEVETNDDFFMNFIELAAVYNDMDIEQNYGYISDEEDLQDRERAEKLQDMVHTIMSDRNMQYALKAAGAHNPIDEGVKKRVITEMTDAVKVRDFRALYAELANDNYYRVEEGEDFTSQLKSHYAENQKRYHDLVRSEDEIDKMSPQQRKMLAAEMNNRDLAAKIRSGELEMSDEIHDYMKSLDRQIDDLKKQMEKLQAETADDYKNLNTVEQRALLRLHDKLLDAKSKHDKSYDYIGKRIQQGLDITDNYKRQEKVLNAGYEGLYKRFNDIKKTMIINQDVELALKHQEDLQKLKDEIARQQQEKKLVAEVKELRKQLVKRTMRRVPLDKVDYDYAKTIIAIQTMLEPNLIGGVNRFIGTKNAFLRGVISGMLTDDDYRKQIIRYIEKTEKASKSSAMFTEKLKNIKDVNEIDTWDEATRQYAIKRLPKENWIRELDLIGLGEERRESMDLNINLIPVDNIRYNENGEEEHYTTYRLDADDEITARVREAVGDNTFNLLFNVPFYQWKTWQLEDLAKIINELYKEGRDVMNAKRLQKMEAAAKIRREIEATINNTGIAINDDDTPEEKAAKQDKINEILGLDDNIKGTNAAKDKGFKANLNRLLHGYNDANVLRFARILDGQKEGVNVQQLYRREDECYISKQKSINERVNKINKVLADNKITQEDLAKTVEVDGRKFTVDELLFFAAANEDYLEDETLVEQGFTGLMANDNYAATSRNAVMFGSMLSDTESLRYKQMLTEEDKDMQQRIQNGQLSHEETFEYITKTLERNPGTKAYISACRERYQKVLDAAAALDPKYQALREVIADDYAEQYERMNETSIQEFNSPVHRTKCYVPIIRLESNGETNVNQVKEDLLGALGGAAGKQWVNKGMSMRRVSMSPLNQKPVQTGLYKTWTSSVERTEHFISYAPYVTDLNRIYKSRDAVFTRAFIEGRYGKGALRYLDDYINEVANPNANKVREAGAQLMHTLRGKTAPAYLSWKLSAIVKQGLTSPFPYMQFVDPLRYIAASAKLITSGGKGYDAIREKSVFMNNRVMDPMNDLIEEMEEQAKTKAGRKLASFEKKGMAGLEWIDWICVAPGWLACYEKEYARLNGKNRDVYENAKLRMQEANMYADYGTASYMTPEQIEATAEKEMMDDLEKRAVQYADDCTRQCQPSNRAADIAPLFKNSSEAMKAYLQFQTSLNVIWQNIRYDIPYSVRQRQFWRIAGCVAGYTLAGIFMNAVMDGLPSNDDDDELKRLKALCYYATTQFTDSVPMIGSELTNTVDKLITGKSNFAASGTDMTPTATKFFSILTNAKQGNWEKAAQMTADGIGMYLGLPVSGLKEIEKLAGVGDGEDGLSLNLGEVYGILDKED